MDEADLPDDPVLLKGEIRRLHKVVRALMNRAERSASGGAGDFGLFQTSILLEGEVRERTRQLEAALSRNEEITRALTEEKEAQARLLARLTEAQTQVLSSEKLASIGQLAAGVAHEINNPIGFIQSNIRTLGRYAATVLDHMDACADHLTPTVVEDLVFIKDEAPDLIAESLEGVDRVRSIVDDLLEFSRVGEVEWSTLDLAHGLDSILNLLGSSLGPGVRIERAYADLPLVECIPSQVNQALMNIVVNAMQALGGSGLLRVATGREGDTAWVSVADSGPGIPPGILSRIFEPFFTTRPQGQGKGLGLAVAYGIVRAHRGEIRVESLPAQGATFTVVLPLLRAVDLPPLA